MALPNRPLTKEEVQQMLDSLYEPLPTSDFIKLLTEPRFQYVRYDASLGRIVYELTDTYYLTDQETPSDSRWMVPGVSPSRRF